MAGDGGRHKNASRVQERYYWRGMWTDINNFVLSCVTCQRDRAVKRAPWGEALLTGTPDYCSQHLHMDSTVDFPKSYVDGIDQPFNANLTFVCRISNFTRFVCARDTDTDENAAVHLINDAIRHHGCPDRIIADNGNRL